MKTLEQFLSESIRPAVTSYGADADMSNMQFRMHPEMDTTYFEVGGHYYMWGASPLNGNGDSYEIVFGASSIKSTDWNDYNVERVSTNNAAPVLGSVMYVTIEYIKFKPTINEIVFSGFDSRLDRLYNAILNSKNMKSSIEQLGFEYVGKRQGKFTITRT
ncbi:hypothetical protein VPHF86_0306 [Vibrio phage F86]